MDKKSKILAKGLELFAKFGFHGVATARIAREAGVSEGLIFRHFASKKGLLAAVMQNIEDRLGQIFQDLIALDDPRQVILTYIETPYAIPESDYDYWRLSFRLKWDQDFYNPGSMRPAIRKLTWAFRKLGSPNPAIEAEMLNQNVESIAISILRDGRKQQLKFKTHLINKYLNE